MWSSFLFTCRWLFIMFTPKSVVPRNFLSIRIALSCFYLLMFYYWEILNLNLTFVLYVNVKLFKWLKLWICENHIYVNCGVKNYVKEDHLSIYRYATFAVAKRKHWPMRCWCSALPIKLTSQVGAGRWIGLLLTHERMMTKFKYEYMKIIYVNCGVKNYMSQSSHYIRNFCSLF